ncbi:MAG: hypothetical protein LIO78_11290, partial [Clostridiales bacterium]|nr:hypothetical protein [Clostridiales bacterium]
LSPISWRSKKWGPPGGQELISFINLSLRKNLKLMTLPFRVGSKAELPLDGGGVSLFKLMFRSSPERKNTPAGA